MNVIAPVSVDMLKSILKTMFMNYKTSKIFSMEGRGGNKQIS